MQKLKELIFNFDWSLTSIVKLAVAFIVIVVAIAIALGVIGSVARGVFGYSNNNESSFVQEIVGPLGFDSVTNSKATFATRGIAVSSDFALSEPGFSPPVFPEEGGGDAEDYERRNYSARYETRRFEETCTVISDLKPLEYVVFNNSSKSENFCNYAFRVEVEYEDDIVAQLKALDPRDFNINTSTIERSIEYSDSELVMQKRRLASTQETLNQAEIAFNSLIARATREGDTKTLSEVINNKISTIDRLTQQLLNTQERIDRLTKGKGDQLEQIEYANFNVSVSKTTFLDGQRFADEWKERIQKLFLKLNATLLALTVGLISFALSAIEFIVFASIAVVGVTIFTKGMWVVVKRIWHWRR